MTAVKERKPALTKARVRGLATIVRALDDRPLFRDMIDADLPANERKDVRNAVRWISRIADFKGVEA